MLITLLTVLLAFAGIVVMVLPIIIDQVTQLVNEVTKLLNRPTVWDDVEAWVNSIFPNLDLNAVFEQAQQWAIENVGAITGGVIGAGIAFVSGLTGRVHHPDPHHLLHRGHAGAEAIGVPARAGIQASALHRPQ